MIMDYLNNENICRICLQRQDPLFSLFTKRKGSSPFEKLIKNTKLKIKINDGGPSTICSQCLIDLDSTVSFLKKCERSNQQMLVLRSRNDGFREIECNSKINISDQEKRFGSCGDNVQYECKSSGSNGIRVEENVVKVQTDKTASRKLMPQCPECGSRRRCQHWEPPSTFSCHYCKKAFAKKYNLKIHMLRHIGVREWACTWCGAPQLSRGLARQHCSPRPRRVCPEPGCPKAFTTKANLNTHIRKHNGERPFECAECGKRFICKGTLKDHIRIHTGEKPYLCAVCGRRFATNKLAAHVATHAGVHARTVPCPVPACHKMFVSPRALRLHSVVHSAVRRTYRCAECPNTYSHKQSLNKHVHKQHPQDTRLMERPSRSESIVN